MTVRTRKELQDYVNNGNQPKFVFFWGHKKPKSGVSKTCFSQWYESAFKIERVRYTTAEHFMMAEKARLFRDTNAEMAILAANNPGQAKAFGREVKGFDHEKWVEHRFDIVVRANFAKFGQNEELKRFLLNTRDRVIVEASPVDKIWGIGLSADDPHAENPNRWKGENLLGFALMEVRSQLSVRG
ncbi:NADAR family protein [Alteromonas sp. ASW11-36]|uniref:NADAR family protein n=1 Tax=Alteromonas arenosi TaxID=3055817 RepID=A0ABT7SXQ3_9ALTE|nr:NADAR family protein [Alteromonas sp. ASW11-36]MDM7860963.1 NADAR family protein [Alteromonas sp. ASW11-36]